MTTAIDALNHYLNFPGGDILTEVVNILEPQWQLTDVYQGNTFFDGFDFFNDTDPTHGFVNYVNKEKAQHDGLIKIDKSSIVMKVDNSTTFATASKNQERGRSSVRISSHKDYDSGLFLFDVEHIPVACGAWPALWLLGPNWPNGGEIDVIEGVNLQSQNLMALHTSSGCKQRPSPLKQTGKTLTNDCDVKSPDQAPNQGCSVEDQSKKSFGSGFNQNGGGIFALQWTAETGIQIWFFDRANIPKDIVNNSNKHPNPKLWGIPSANFPFDPNYCTFRSFSKLKIIINTTFCGDWAGNSTIYKKHNCPGQNCIDFIRKNPNKLNEAYWRIRSIKVYKLT
ncbi:beta-1,3-1,4-glucanase [Circinella umbellata]|nr:beta-1,3-1,4-glucanase [Circinella umbellata]